MKIGIITFHFVPNHGAVLQCHALQTYLEKQGHSVCVINYQPSYHTIRYSKSKNPVKYASWYRKRSQNASVTKQGATYARSFLRCIALNLQGSDAKVMDCFDNYTGKYLHLTEKYVSLKELRKAAPECDVYITGSDQLWNPELLDQELDEAYFLHFGGKNIYRFSYGISLGKKQKESFYREVAEACRLLDQISLREDSKELRSLLDKDVSICVDPVFLLDAKDYAPFESDTGEKAPYLFVFGFETTEELEKAIALASKKYCCKLINGSPHRIRLGLECEKVRAYGPGEFLHYVRHAKCIITNSFHATAFSILYHKDFITVPHSTRGLRMNHLLDSLGLCSKSYGNPAFDLEQTPDWDLVDERIRALRAHSETYLRDCLAKAEENRKSSSPQNAKGACCGCTACLKACPVQAIKLEEDEEGFLYPVISEEKCIHCHKCEEICAFHRDQREKTFQKEGQVPKSYAVKHKSTEVRMESRSGGFFTALSDEVLKRGGVIYGCVLTKDFTAVMARAENPKERDLMRGSKYIQSKMGDVYLQVRKDLEDGRQVLFTGTSCQVAGLLAYLGKPYENLICADIVCHGVPSPLVWKKYLAWQEKRHHGVVENVSFRNKRDHGWRKHVESLYLEDGRRVDSEVFKTLFYGHGILRPCCYECPYKSLRHPGDLTMADCWGIDRTLPDFHDDQGVSLVLVNSKKGQDIFDNLEKDLEIREISMEKCMQTPLKAPFPRPSFRDSLWEELMTDDFDTVVRRYGRDPMAKFWKKKIKSILRKS